MTEVEFLRSYVEHYVRAHGSSIVTFNVELDVHRECYVMSTHDSEANARISVHVDQSDLERDRQAALRQLDRNLDGIMDPVQRRERVLFTQLFAGLPGSDQPWDIRQMPATSVPVRAATKERKGTRARKSVEPPKSSVWDLLMDKEFLR